MKRSEKARERGERYIQLKSEFQKIARRDKKDFFDEQCLIIEGNNKRGKIRDLLRKIGNIKEEFHPKMGTIKGKNSKVLLDAEEIKKRWNDYKEELYKKGS